MNENLDQDQTILEAMGLVEPLYPVDTTDATQELLDRMAWMRQELCRRYLLGAMKHLDESMIKAFKKDDVIPGLDAKAILMNALNLNTPGFELFLQDLADECIN